ncbi:MAG: hypothetical protein O2871_01210 [bacterium]|nr:hypothetical protein [bacterium]
MVNKKDYTKKKPQIFELKDKPLTVYKSGNSNVITIPSYLDIKPGDKILLGNIKKIDSEKERIARDMEIINKLAGSMNLGTKNMTPEELDDELEGVYD